MSLHISFVVDNVIQSSLGGGFIRVMRYARELASRDVHFTWITTESDTDAAFEEHWNVRVKTVEMPATLPMARKREQLLRAAYEEAARHKPGERLVSTFACRLSSDTIRTVFKGKRAGIPSYHNTSMLPGPLPERWLQTMRLKMMTRLFLEGHAAFVPQTETMRRFYASYFGFAGPRSQIIGNGVDCVQFAPATADERAAARRRLGLPEDAPVVVTMGGVVPRKRIDLLIEAWPQVLHRFPTARLVIAGTLGRRATFNDAAPSLEDYARKIETMVAALPNPASVLLTAEQVREVDTYLKAADVFAFTSEREGLPNAVLEAMACGLPCVLCPFAGFPPPGEEFGNPLEHYLPSAAEPAAIATEIIQLLENREKRETIGTAARQLVERTQNLPMILNQWEDLYRKITAL
ncbi:MAG: glycosyltransferase family 4 protein [Prosthecobacter sp.]